jgi:putative PIN family toxin of toxin-antitoxin system
LRKNSKVSKILVDTCVFIRLGGEYKDTHECIMNSSDVICVTKKIIAEYAGRSTSSPLFHLRPFLSKLEQKKKLLHIKQSYVTARVKTMENSKTFHYPTHNNDKKWIETAIATKAKYIISTNKHILDLPSNRYNGEQTDHVDPITYNSLHNQSNTFKAEHIRFT